MLLFKRQVAKRVSHIHPSTYPNNIACNKTPSAAVVINYRWTSLPSQRIMSSNSPKSESTPSQSESTVPKPDTKENGTDKEWADMLIAQRRSVKKQIQNRDTSDRTRNNLGRQLKRLGDDLKDRSEKCSKPKESGQSTE